MKRSLLLIIAGSTLFGCAPEDPNLSGGGDTDWGKADGFGREAVLSAELLAMAQGAAELAHSEGRGLGQPDILTIVDFSLSSDHRRLWVVDTSSGEILFNERAAHGRNSGDYYNATSFSNVYGSYQSSLGLYEVNETGVGGSVGPYVALDGLEPGYNSNARDREIIVHGASYASDDFYERNGYTGRSLGCVSVRPNVIGDIMNTISGGSLLLIYYPDEDYLRDSSYISDGPSTSWVGTLCERGDDLACDYSYGAVEGFCFDDGGFCVMSCEGTCPDRYNHATTFCVESPEGVGMCVSKAEAANRYCDDIPGTVPQIRNRYLGSSSVSTATAEVCLPAQ